MKNLFLALAFCLPFGLTAQGVSDLSKLKLDKSKLTVPRSITSVQPVARIQAQKYANSITASDLKAHLKFIASDELEGRATAERGQKLAALYLATQFEKMGLAPGNGDSYFQSYNLTLTSVSEIQVSYDGKKKKKFGKDFFIFEKWPFTHNYKNELVFAGFGIEDKKYNNLEGLNLKGNAVLILAGEPSKDGKSIFPASTEDQPTYGYEEKRLAAEKAGASSILYVMPDERFERYRSNPWLKHMMEKKSMRLSHLIKAEIPVIFISESVAEGLIKKSKKSVAQLKEALAGSAKCSTLNFGKNRLEIDAKGTEEVVSAENVLGFIEGTDKKNEVVVLTAHYDHLGIQDGVVFNGADDDGTGTVALLEIAEAFMQAVKEGKRPRRSILIMPVSGEEKGLLGSRYYTDNPIYKLENTVCNLNIDMIGRVDKHHDNPDYVYVIGSDMLSTDLHKANEKANLSLGEEITLDYKYNTKDDPNRYYYRSDHYNFAKNGIPCIFYFSGVHEDYHKATDTMEKIDFDRTAKVTRLVFTTAWEVANREQRLKVDKE